jgi:hypothetical protein
MIASNFWCRRSCWNYFSGQFIVSLHHFRDF